MKLDAALLGPALSVLAASIDAGELAGAVLSVGVGGEAVATVALGAAERLTAGEARPMAGARPMEEDSLFDLASVTKVMATLPVVLHLVSEAAIGLDEPVSAYLPAFSGDGRGRVTLRHLLTHTAGFAGHRKYWEWASGPEELLSALYAEEPTSLPGSVVRYSDVGFLLLGEVVRSVSGLALDEAADRFVFAPLGLSHTGFNPPPALAATAAATEPWPDGSPRVGTVHDENAALLGGVAGHAGLFSTAGDVGRYLGAWTVSGGGAARMFAGDGLMAEALRCQTEGLGGRRGLGWTARLDSYDHLGQWWPEGAVGHTGFTGTSVGLDRASGVWAVLLTNAVHLGRERCPIVALRRSVHDALAGAVSVDGRAWAG